MKTNKKSAFTLIELLVVVSIILILASIIAPAIKNANHKRAIKQEQVSRPGAYSRDHDYSRD